MTMDMTHMRKGVWKGVGGGPKRTLLELADELGVSRATLVLLLTNRNGPKPVLRQSSAALHSTWYDPKAVRAWWASIPEDVRKKVAA